MRFVMIAILSMAALGSGVSATKSPPAPFDGAWMSCETWQGMRICGYNLHIQRGSRVCGVQSYFATNRTYVQRLVGTATGTSLRIDKICGDPGSETDTYCAGAAPSSAEKVGWGTSDQQLLVCNGRLYSAKQGEEFSCAAAVRAAGLPKVRSLKGEGPQPEDLVWLKSCATGSD